MTILSYDEVINNRINNIPLKVSKTSRKSNTLSSKAYECNDVVKFNVNGNRAYIYGLNDCIYWIETSFNKSGKKYVLYTLRADGTLLIHDTNTLLNPNDTSTFLNKSFGIVCNVYQAPVPLIPIDTLKNGYSIGLLFDSEYKELTSSNPGHASGLSDPTNLDTFKRLTGRPSPPSFGAPSFLDKGSSKYPLYGDYVSVLNSYSDSPDDYYKTRCIGAIEASRGAPSYGYSPILGDMYDNGNINMSLTYQYGYITYQEYLKNNEIIKGYNIYYKIVNYEGDPNEIKIDINGVYTIDDMGHNYNASLLYIPLNAQGLLWQREYNNMVNSGKNYDKIYNILTGTRRGGLDDPLVKNPIPTTPTVPTIDPTVPVDVPDTNPNENQNQNPPNTNPPIDTDPNTEYNPTDPDITPPVQNQDTGVTEQNNNDNSGTVNTNQDVINTANGSEGFVGNINELLKDLGVEIRENGTNNIISATQLLEQEPKEEKKTCEKEVGILVEDKGKIEIPVYRECNKFKVINRRSNYIYFW